MKYILLKKGSNQYKKKYRAKYTPWIIVFAIFLLVIGILGGALKERIWRENVLSPLPDNPINYHIQIVEIIKATEPTIDDYVDKYSDKYGKTIYLKNRTKVVIHYLLLREQNYGASNKCGDNGLACGILQFHENTYIGYRKIMIKEGLTNHIGSRMNIEDAIETCAWAINNGKEKAWGPIYRGEIKI